MNNYYNRSPRSHCNLLFKSENIVMGKFPPKCTHFEKKTQKNALFASAAAVLYDMLKHFQTFRPNIFDLLKFN